MFCRPDFNETHKTVREYDRPKHQQSDVPTEVERKAGTQHEQREAQEREKLEVRGFEPLAFSLRTRRSTN